MTLYLLGAGAFIWIVIGFRTYWSVTKSLPETWAELGAFFSYLIAGPFGWFLIYPFFSFLDWLNTKPLPFRKKRG